MFFLEKIRCPFSKVNVESYDEYVEKVFSVVTNYGGKHLVRGGQITAITNNWEPEKIVIIEFQNKKQMKQCFQSSEYLEIAPLREASTISKAIIVEGCS